MTIPIPTVRMILLVLLGAGASSARAQGDPIERAEALMNEADFLAALSVLDETEEVGSLDRARLLRLWELRARLNRAGGHMDLVQRDIHRIASVDGSYSFGDDVAPDLRQALERTHAQVEPATLHVTAVPVEGEVRVVAELRGGHAALSHTIRIHTRLVGAQWHLSEGAFVSREVSPDQTLQYYVTVHGPARALLWQEGSGDAPLELRVSPVAALHPPPTDAQPQALGDEGQESPRTESSRSLPPKRWKRRLGWTTAVLVVVGGAVAAGLLFRPEPQTRLGPPMPREMK